MKNLPKRLYRQLVKDPQKNDFVAKQEAPIIGSGANNTQSRKCVTMQT